MLAQRGSTTHTLDDTPPQPPAWLVAELTRRHTVDLLVGVAPASPAHCTHTLSVDEALGPLPWPGKAALVNPPHQRGFAGRLLDRARHEVQRPDSDVAVAAVILPGDAAASYFHTALEAALHGTAELVFVRGRLTFGGRQRASTTGTVIAVLRRSPAPWGRRRRGGGRRCKIAAVSTLTTPTALLAGDKVNSRVKNE